MALRPEDVARKTLEIQERLSGCRIRNVVGNTVQMARAAEAMRPPGMKLAEIHYLRAPISLLAAIHEVLEEHSDEMTAEEFRSVDPKLHSAMLEGFAKLELLGIPVHAVH